MDDWNDFGAIQPPDPRSPSSHPSLTYPSSSSDSSSSNSSIVLHHSSSELSDQHPPSNPPSNPPSLHDATSDRGSFLSSLPFLSRKRHNHSRPSSNSPHPPQPSPHPPSHPASDLADDGLVPLERTALADRSVDDAPDAISTGSDSDGREPKSRYISRLIESNNTDDDDSSSALNPKLHVPRKGDLDDVPLDYEFNIEGFRITSKPPPKSTSSDGDPHSSVISSSVLRTERTYTKLEVISSRDIRSLVSFFNVFIVIALVYTLVLIILGNTKFLKDADPLIREELLTEEQKAISRGPLRIPESALAFRTILDHPSVHSERKPTIAQIAADRFKCQGLYWNRNGLIRGPKRPDLCLSPLVQASLRQEEQPPSDISTLPSTEGELFFSFYAFSVTISVLSNSIFKLNGFVYIFLSMGLFFIGLLFTIRILRSGRRNITHEQIWVVLLIFVSSLYLNAFESVLRLVELFNFNPTGKAFADPILKLEASITVLRDAGMEVVTYFYLWASFHSYRILDPLVPLGFRSFYLTKLIVLLPYCALLPIAHYAIKVRLSDVPLLSAPAFSFYYGEFRVFNHLKAEISIAIVKTIYEVALTGIIIFEAYRTMKVLGNASYMKYRTKRVGFRFFLYLNFVFYVLYFILQCILLFGKPKGENISLLDPGSDIPAGDVLFVWAVGPGILLFGYVVCTAHVFLPCDSVGAIKGWFVSSDLAVSGSRWSFTNTDSNAHSESPSVVGTEKEEKMKVGEWTNDEDTYSSLSEKDSELKRPIIEPFTYQMGESKTSLQLKANCFTMQTHVIMFNFAWYVYYYATPKLARFRPKQNPLPFAFDIAEHIKSETTDTQVLVVDCTDRIIITFRGTTSMKNLRTSVQMNHAMLSSVVRTSVTGEDESARLKRLFGSHYLKGKVHRGFATAYCSVADRVMETVRVLREKKKRPVFLTGHSLGGALATLCSLDLWVKLDISRREIFVSTFGSPRVGNLEFAAVYGEVVPLHWRIVVHPDMVAKLPRIGYTHVGKKVVLTPHGEMLIDPSALEQRPWSGEAAGFAYHRKASYMLAMRAWCVRNHEMTYTPVFWPFPVRPDDERRFAGAFGDDSEGNSGRKIAAKIIRMDAMVDALGRSDGELANMAVVEKWARLARRVLLNDQLTRS